MKYHIKPNGNLVLTVDAEEQAILHTLREETKDDGWGTNAGERAIQVRASSVTHWNHYAHAFGRVKIAV